MPIALPFVTRSEIVREYRPDETVTVDSAMRSLRSKNALSPGLSIATRAAGGQLGGRLHLYSALNRDAARAVRRHDFVSAVRIAKAAARLDASPEAKRLASSVAIEASAAGAAGLARALAAPGLLADVAALQRKIARARAALKPALAPTVLSGRISGLSDAVAMVSLEGLSQPVPVPLSMVEAVGAGTVGAAVSAMWELLPGGRSILTLEPAVDAPEVNALGEPLVDLYGTAWGRVLTAADADALHVTGTPTVRIPAGVPDVE
jgi:hypothetical protein